MHRPFFSIIIPTYNRSEYLKIAIVHLLNQNFHDFEIIISDNYSKDNTKNIVRSFKNKKIKYYRNKKNIEVIPNIIKALRRANGKYFLLHGDDDYLYLKNSLKELHNLIEKSPKGYFRLNYLSIRDNKVFDYKMSKGFKRDQELNMTNSNDEVFDFIEKSDPYFMSGICLKRFKIKESNFTKSELAPWFPISFINAKKFGAYYCSNYFLVANWATKPDHPLYRLINGKFTFESHLDNISKIVSKKKYIELKLKLIKRVIFFFPLAKIYKGSNAVLSAAKRLIYLYPKTKFSIYFWFSLLLSLILPSIVIRYVREYYLRFLISKSNAI